MIPSLLRGLRLALILSTATIGAVWPIHERVAYADDDEEEDEEDGDEDEGEEEEEEDTSQPPVTAGGLFTLKTYPINELLRPLTMTKGITQLRAGFGVDVSDKTAFESVGLSLDGEYGLQDHFTLRGGFTSQYNFKQFAVSAGVEGALAYDFIDVRVEGVLRRPAAPDAMGDYVAGKIKGGIDLGFPFRYAAKPEIAIVALDTLMSIDFDSKPDLTPSLGIATNPIPAVSIVVFAKLIIIDFDTKGPNLQVPATARIQFSPSQKLDLGAEFTFLNLKVPEGSEKKFYDDRFLTLYAAFRM